MVGSTKQIYKIGRGSGSSHTVAPIRASKIFLTQIKGLPVDRIEVTLYGSLTTTDKGHVTDQAILFVLNPVHPTVIPWEPRAELTFHPDGMRFVTFDKEGRELRGFKVYNIGGSMLANESFDEQVTTSVYELSTMANIIEYLDQRGLSYWKYAESCERPDVWNYFTEVWEVMKQSAHEGLTAEGVLPDGLRLRRKTADTLIKSLSYKGSVRTRDMIYSYALVVSERSAAGRQVVTAPMYGSCGVVPAVLLYLQKTCSFRDEHILYALAAAGLFVNVMRTSASISDTEVGCQGEVDAACAMAVAAASQLLGGTLHRIEYAAEMGLEHHPGLTCDPVYGLAQIPCVERNTFATSRALDTNIYANFTDGRHRVSFDQAITTMHQTGRDLPSLYKETAKGELALLHERYGGKILVED